MQKFLIIQTAFIGDVILATPLIEAIRKQYPSAKIDFLLRKGNESLLHKHPHLNKVLIWDKKSEKYKGLIKLIKEIRSENYDFAINIQRFGATGLLTALSKAKSKIGFKNNPFAFTFNYKINHSINKGFHETERNLNLLNPIFEPGNEKPVLYPTENDFKSIKKYLNKPYICAAPTSVWFTKQFPASKWIEFFNQVPNHIEIFLLGGPTDFEACKFIQEKSSNPNIKNLAGKLKMLASAALMKNAKMNFVNDSAPMHMASSVNAPTTAIFCSTVPAFGFGPLSKDARIIEVKEKLECRPCGLHGHRSCPENHFNCAYKIDIKELLNSIQ